MCHYMLNVYADLHLTYGAIGESGRRVTMNATSTGANLSIKCLHMFINNFEKVVDRLPIVPVMIEKATNQQVQFQLRKQSWRLSKNNQVSTREVLFDGSGVSY